MTLSMFSKRVQNDFALDDQQMHDVIYSSFMTFIYHVINTIFCVQVTSKTSRHSTLIKTSYVWSCKRPVYSHLAIHFGKFNIFVCLDKFALMKEQACSETLTCYFVKN